MKNQTKEWIKDQYEASIQAFQRVYVRGYGGQDDGTVTLTVAVDGRFNLVAFERSVFGIPPERLTPTERTSRRRASARTPS